MSLFAIEAEGCDDSTTAVLDLLPEEAEVMERVAAHINSNSHSGCMPRLIVRRATGRDIEADKEAQEYPNE